MIKLRFIHGSNAQLNDQSKYNFEEITAPVIGINQSLLATSSGRTSRPVVMVTGVRHAPSTLRQVNLYVFWEDIWFAAAPPPLPKKIGRQLGLEPIEDVRASQGRIDQYGF